METEETDLFSNGILNESLPPSNHEPAAYWRLSTKEPGMLERAEPDPPRVIPGKELNKPKVTGCDTVLIISDDSDTEEPVSNLVEPNQYPGTIIVVEQNPQWNPNKDGINVAMWIEETHPWKVVNTLQEPAKQTVELHWENHTKDPSILEQRDKYPHRYFPMEETCMPKHSNATQSKWIKNVPSLPIEIEEESRWKELKDDIEITQIIESHCLLPDIHLLQQRDELFSTKMTEKEHGKTNQVQKPYWNLPLENLDVQRHIEVNHLEMSPLKAPCTSDLMDLVPKWNASNEEPERPKLTEDYQTIFIEGVPGPLKSINNLQMKVAEKRQGKFKHMAETQWMATNENPDRLKQIENPKLNLRTEHPCTPECNEEPWIKKINTELGSPKLSEVPQRIVSQNAPAELKVNEESQKHVPKHEIARKKHTEESWCKTLNEQLGATNHLEVLELKKLKDIKDKQPQVTDTKCNLNKDEELDVPACAQEAWKKVLKQERGSPTLIEVPQWTVPKNPPAIPTLKDNLLNKIQKYEPSMLKERENSDNMIYNKALSIPNVVDKELKLKSLLQNTDTSTLLNGSQKKIPTEDLCTSQQTEELWKMDLKKELGSPPPIIAPQSKGSPKGPGKPKLDNHRNHIIKHDPIKSKQTEQSQCKVLNGEPGTLNKTEVPNLKVYKKDKCTPKQIEGLEFNLDKLTPCTPECSEEPWRKILKQERGSPTPVEAPKQTVPQKVSGKHKMEAVSQQKFIKEEPSWTTHADEPENKVLNKDLVDSKQTEEGPKWKMPKEEPDPQKQMKEPPIKIPKEEPGIIEQAKVPQQTMLTEMDGLSKQTEIELFGKVPKEEPVTSDFVQEHRKGSFNDLNIGMTHSLSKNTFQNILNKYLDPSIDYSKQPGCPSGRHMYRCLACAKLFMSPSYLKSHYYMHLQQKPGECPVCKKRFIWPSRLQRHLLEHTGPWPYRCSVCQNNSNDHRVGLNQDSYNHTADKLYKCISCKLCFVNAYDLQRHKQKHHSPFSVIGFSEKSQTREMGRFQCPACSRSFDSDFSLRVHKCRSNRKRLHVCSVCGMQFKYPYYLARHYAIHTKVKPFQCSICLKSFRRLTHLTRHYLIHSSGQPYPPIFCSKTVLESTECQENPLKHTEINKETQMEQMEISTGGAQNSSWKMENAMEGKETIESQKDRILETPSEEKRAQIKNDWPLLCLACNQTFERQWDISIHKCPGTLGIDETTDGPKKHQCAVCKKYFASPWSLNRHHRVHTKEKPFTCAECGMSFRLMSSMKQHSRTHMVNLPFSCTLCHQSFQKSNDLSQHLQGHAEEEPYRCIYCDRSFSQACSMQQHQQTHAHIHAALRATKEELPSPDLGDYQCHSCNTIYPDAKGLQEHDCPNDLSNSGDTLSHKAYECNVCEKTFKGKYDLASHFLIHTGELPFQCDQCGKRFRRLSHLKQHDVSHTVERPFQCMVCKKEFKRLADLSRHREVHNNLKSYQCGVCFKFFSRSYSLLRHQRSHDPAFVPNLGQGTLLSNSCFDSQDHSAFSVMEDEQEK